MTAHPLASLRYRFLLNALIKKFYHPERGPITSFSHRLLSRGSFHFHRVYAKGVREKAFGVGMDSDLYRSQLVALMEYLERDYWATSGCQETTSGVCCHTSKRAAKHQALLELIERDQVLLSVYYGEHLFEIEDHPCHPHARLFYLTWDLPVHVMMAAIKIEENQFAFGFGCSLVIQQAMEKAFKEALLIEDSKNFEVKVLHGNLIHLVPFLKPAYRMPLPKFNLSDYCIRRVSGEAFSPYPWFHLMRVLREKGIDARYDTHKRSVGFLMNISLVVAQSPQLQPLFFSGTDIKLNPKRLQLSKLPEKPLHLVLHPIS